jgi:hypothetical protein
MGNEKAAVWNIDDDIATIESLCRGVPGTSISRVLAISDFAYSQGVKWQKGDGASLLLWCLGFGRYQESRRFFYGRTIRECVLKAKRDLACLQGRREI